MENLEYIAEGAGHVVFNSPNDSNKVVKIPKNNFFSLERFSYDRAATDVEIFRERFGKWMPATTVENVEDDQYIIHQQKINELEYISTEVLESADIRKEVDEILDINHSSYKEDGIGIDFIGLEGSMKCAFSSLEHLKGGMVEKFGIVPFIKAVVWFSTASGSLPVPKNALDVWQEEITPEISNVVLGDNGNGTKQVFLIDQSLVHSKSRSFSERRRSLILNTWNQHFLKKQFDLEMGIDKDIRID